MQFDIATPYSKCTTLYTIGLCENMAAIVNFFADNPTAAMIQEDPALIVATIVLYCTVSHHRTAWIGSQVRSTK